VNVSSPLQKVQVTVQHPGLPLYVLNVEHEKKRCMDYDYIN